MNGRVGYRSRLNISRSVIPLPRTSRAEIVPATHRLRRTATVSTSTRSGADTSPAPRISAEARRPSVPSSPTTLARMEASTTINGGRRARRCPRLLAEGRRARPGAVRSGRALRPSSAVQPGVSIRRRDTAGSDCPRLVGSTLEGGVDVIGDVPYEDVRHAFIMLSSNVPCNPLPPALRDRFHRGGSRSRSRHATRSYSWISPPSTSRRLDVPQGMRNCLGRPRSWLGW